MGQLKEIYKKYKTQFNIGAGVGTSILIYNGILQILIINIFTLIYLTYKSIYLLEHKSLSRNRAMLIRQLKQWICYAFYMMIEYNGDILFKFVPLSFFYYLSKLMLFLWIIQSDDNLNKIYDNWVLYYYNKYNYYLKNVARFMEKIAYIYRKQVDTYIKQNFVYMKNMAFGYIDDLIREKVINGENDIIKLLDKKSTKYKKKHRISYVNEDSESNESKESNESINNN